MKLIILHYHYRPGGVRRVIESAVPFIVRELPAIDSVIFAGGEARDLEWNRAVEKSVAPVATEFFIEPSFGYVSEQKDPAGLSVRIRAGLARLFQSNDSLVWAHNLAIARNLPLARELARVCSSHSARLIAHHHDWWFDNRWLRWPEMRQTGFRTLPEVARALFPNAQFAAINRADAAMLRKHVGPRVGWLPNPTPRGAQPSLTRVRAARDWMCARLGDDAPVWLMPCRLLRRKNIVEALLLTRWLRPEATLVTTGGASSADEKPYAQRLAAAARKHGWRWHPGLLDPAGADTPPIADLLAASECLLLTSVQEGFGLASLEAAAAARPLIVRRLPNIAPDLHRFGFRFPHSYPEVWIAPEAFDGKAERARQRALFSKWKRTLPRSCRAWTGHPSDFESPGKPFPFSRLTLTAQLEVLALPPEESWQLCARWNPLIRRWKSPAADAALEVTSWPASADHWLDGRNYARRFAKMARGKSHAPFPKESACAAQEDFIRQKLQGAHLFPLLFGRDETRA